MANQVQSPGQTTITSVGTATTGGTANSAKPVIVGTAQPLSTVEIFDGVRLIGIAGADKYGNWTFTPTSNVSTGVHQFSALAIDAMGVFGPVSTPVSAPYGGREVPNRQRDIGTWSIRGGSGASARSECESSVRLAQTVSRRPT